MASILDRFQLNSSAKILIALLGAYLVYHFLYRKKTESLDNTDANVSTKAPLVQPQEPPLQAPAPPSEQQRIQQVIADKSQLQANDLLPQYDDANEFAKQNPVSSLLKEQNFLISGYHVGVNTVMQSNKIPYHDIRSAPPIPKSEVGPWSQSSYEVPTGAGRRQLEVGI
jgi:hypothetical protein